MRSEQRLVWLAMMAILLAGSGCCCVQGMPRGCGTSSCGPCGMSGLASCSSCAGGCGERYVDEWVSEPPTVDACCAGDCRPVRSLLRALWGSRFVGGCDMCGGCDSGCDGGCDSAGCSSCGYASSGGSGCTSCGGDGMVSGGGGCSSCGGGGGAVHGVPTEAAMPSAARRMPSHANHMASDGEPQLVPGSYRISEPRRVNASVASERINPARQKIDAKRASYAGQ